MGISMNVPNNLVRCLTFTSGTNVFVVGDIHGCYSILFKELDKLGFNFQKDILISVGDLIDRGDENLECITLLDYPWFHMIRGNHEEMCILGRSDKSIRDMHSRNGGEWFYNLSEHQQQQIAQKFSELPVLIEINTGIKKIGFVHADVEINDWELLKQDIQKGNYSIPGVTSAYKNALWGRGRLRNYSDQYDVVTKIDEIYLGHTIVREPVQIDNCFYIDVGSFYTKKLFIKKVS